MYFRMANTRVLGNLGALFRSRDIKEYSILGSMLGPLAFGNTHIMFPDLEYDQSITYVKYT